MDATSPRSHFVEEIDFDEIELLEVVGKGSFGKVNKAKWRNKIVAVKTIESESERKAFIVERQQLSRVSHPNIVRLYGACTGSVVCLVMEYAEGGSLYNVLHGTPQAIYNAGHAMSWARQCAEGVAYLHDMKPKALIHRDLKPPNLLLIMGGTVLKICDFGTACDIHTQMTNNKGSAAWMAPEVFEGCKYSEKCDVFSYGIILWELLTRRKPFDEIGGPAFRIMWAVHSGQRPPPIKGCPKEIEWLMTMCWQKDPTMRPSMGEIVQRMTELCQFFRGGDEPIRYPASEDGSIESYSSGELLDDPNEDGTPLSASSSQSGTQVPSPITTPSSKEGSVSSSGSVQPSPLPKTPSPTPTSTRPVVLEKQLSTSSDTSSRGQQSSAPASLANSQENLMEVASPQRPRRRTSKTKDHMKRLSADVTYRMSDLKIDVEDGQGHRKSGSYGCLVTGSVDPRSAPIQEWVKSPNKPERPPPPQFLPPSYRSDFTMPVWPCPVPPPPISTQDPIVVGSPNVGTSEFAYLMLEPQYQPLPPYGGSTESMQVFEDHKKMAQEYFRVQAEMNHMLRRKKELADELAKGDSSDVEEVLQLQSEKEGLLELRQNLKKQLEMLRKPRSNSGDESWVMLP